MSLIFYEKDKVDEGRAHTDDAMVIRNADIGGADGML